MATISQKLLDELAEVIPALAIHIAGDEDLRSKMAAMYKILVTGNGSPPLPEIVRIHSAWITAHDAINQDILNQKSELDKEARLFKKQILILFIGQVITLAVVLLNLK